MSSNQIAETARVSPLADLEESSRGSRIIVEAGCTIDAFVKIKFSGGTGDVRIGPHSFVNSGSVIYSGHGVTIGAHVLIAANVTIVGADHEYRDSDHLIVEQRFAPSRGGILIEDDVWIGAGAVILDGARIRRGAVVGALSLARGEIEPYGVYAGVPAVRRGIRKPGGAEGPRER